MADTSGPARTDTPTSPSDTDGPPASTGVDDRASRPLQHLDTPTPRPDRPLPRSGALARPEPPNLISTSSITRDRSITRRPSSTADCDFDKFDHPGPARSRRRVHF